MLHTTLEILRRNHACASGYKNLIASLPADHAHDAPITLAHIIESNGIEDALWALRATVEPTGRNVAQEIAIRAAERAQAVFEKHRPDDSRVRECIAATRAYMRGEISRHDLLMKRAYADAAAADAAYAAAYAAANAAGSARVLTLLRRELGPHLLAGLDAYAATLATTGEVSL